MGLILVLTLSFILSIFPSFAQLNEMGKHDNLQTYIVHVKRPDNTFFAESEEDLESYYESFLPRKTLSSSDQQTPERMIYAYHNVISGFAARLTAAEVKEMAKNERFLSAKPQRLWTLQTTETPNFLGLHQNMGFWRDSNYGKGVIIGVLDTGILPYHPSFSDKGMPPPPPKWKGKCDFETCNNKIIGARSFTDGSGDTGTQPVDNVGHGTHVSGTAAGNFVEDANVEGLANGTAAGMAPLAHLAMYKVCASDTCAESNILAGLDAAIHDGVDVLSLSFGSLSFAFHFDSTAIGTFAAIQKGIFVSCAAGNFGPGYRTLSNDAPWMLTVGAGTVDRLIMAKARLGNGEEFEGQSISQPKDFPSASLPLVYGAQCDHVSLQNNDVKGKIVLCVGGGGLRSALAGEAVKEAGGAAMVIAAPEDVGSIIMPMRHVLPTSEISYLEGLKIMAYINSTSAPTATIFFNGTVVGIPSAPMVARFSSRGPSSASPGILKPDILGPGVSVVAAFPAASGGMPSNTSFFFLSGTSMSCPHLSGVAALLRGSHPDWSPAAIKSAIITSADINNLGGEPITDHLLQPANVFSIGGGHVNPTRANDPGLVYDLQPDDYIPYLCGLGYDDKQVGMITQQNVKCSNEFSIPEAQLNYPSFSIDLGSANQTYTRTVTNVGEPNSSYNLELDMPKGVAISVEPIKLNFSAVNQKQTYNVTFSRSSNGKSSSKSSPYFQGALKWVSDKHTVRSPIAVMLN